VVKVNDQTVHTLWGYTLVSPIYHSFNSNPFAAFPSLHAAFPMLASVYAWQRYRPLAIGLALWTAAVMLSIVYLGEHYVVDALVSVFYVAVATLIVEIVGRRRSRRGAGADAEIPAKEPAAGVRPATPSA
jgi:membrane-associated phospholipid phosphatase